MKQTLTLLAVAACAIALGYQLGQRTALSELQANPHKRVKGISLDSALGRLSFLRLRTGFWIAGGTDLLYYGIPDRQTLETEHYEWYRSLDQ